METAQCGTKSSRVAGAFHHLPLFSGKTSLCSSVTSCKVNYCWRKEGKQEPQGLLVSKYLFAPDLQNPPHLMPFREQHLARQPSSPHQIGKYLGARLSAIPAQHPSASLVPAKPRQGGIFVSGCLLARTEVPFPTCQLLQGRSVLARDSASPVPGFTCWQQEGTSREPALTLEAERKLKTLSSQH